MDLRGKKVTVVGMGKTALALVRLLQREGARPFVTDADDAAALGSACAQLDALDVPYQCAGHTDAAFADAAFAVLSPGVSAHVPAVEQARRQGVTVLGEMELAFRFCRSRLLAVTGTNGKTTTTELLRSLVAACGHAVLLAGNNDVPLSAAVLADPAPEFIVLEVSSYQLENTVTFRPWMAAVLNVTPDHLARHETMERYAAVKAQIFAQQSRGDVAVLNEDDAYVARMAVPPDVTVRGFSLEHRARGGLWLDGEVIREGAEPVAQRADVPLPGRHNTANALAALTMMRAGGFDWDKTWAALRAFQGVEHRIEHVVVLEGVDFYNDSKSTNIDSLRVALDSFDRPIVLIAGGRGKGADYRVLREAVRSHVKALVTMGEDAALLAEAFGDLVPTDHVGDMAEAVAQAAAAARPGDIVLLSPGCASFDLYDDFAHRGRVFKDEVRRHVPQHAADKESVP